MRATQTDSGTVFNINHDFFGSIIVRVSLGGPHSRAVTLSYGSSSLSQYK
jgi:hypothetical protein